jgi:hypothetical protein
VPRAGHAGTAVDETDGRRNGANMIWKKKKTGLGRKRQTRASLKARESNREQRAHKNKASDGPDSSTLEVALQYASIGLSVFPLHAKSFAGKCSCNRKCSEPGKHPRVKKATTDSKLIKKYWTKWPDAKIGMPLGSSSGFLALVVKGAVGQKSLRALEEKQK